METINSPEKQKKRKKSRTKANGLKSVLMVGDKLLMTSFGEGSRAVVEKTYEDGGFSHEVVPENFSVVDRGNRFEVHRQGVLSIPAAMAEKPTELREDMLGAKARLEKYYFGMEMNDNLHIQLIYNILDIEKILAVYIDNIIYSIGNVCRDKGKAKDLIYKLGKGKYEEHKEDVRWILQSERLSYLGGAFYEYGKDKKSRKRQEKEIFYEIDILGALRQFLKHGGEKGEGKRSGRKSTWLYNLERILNEEQKKVLDKIYKEKINVFNRKFMEYSGKDLTILFSCLDVQATDAKKEIAKSYYRHVVYKDMKNMGFSIKKLREKILDNHASFLRADDYCTVRSKLYRLIDYVIWLQYTDRKGEEKVAGLVNQLRSCMDNSEKESIYDKEATNLWEKETVRLKIKRIADMLKGGSRIKDIKVEKDLSGEWIADVCVCAKDTSYFSKLMYLLTLFLDGKEINELLTTLINKFENIQSFVDLIKGNGLVSFSSAQKNNDSYGYCFFENSGKISVELRTIRSFAHMEAPLPDAKPFMVVDAAKVLGFPDGSVNVEKVNKAVYGENYAIYHDKIPEAKAKFLRENPGKKFNEKQFFKNDTGFRNFLINNVIKSNRFRYLVRYANPDTVRVFAKNRQLVNFVLKRIPDTQIKRYWKSCGHDKDCIDYRFMRKELADDIINVNFEQFEHVPQREKLSEEKQRLQAVLGLYLTVLYVITKNLVNVNSRYTIAVHCLERDATVFGMPVWFSDKEKEPNSSRPCCMVDRFIEKEEEKICRRKEVGKRLNMHSLICIKENRDDVHEYEKEFYHCFRIYRNKVAHLDAIFHATDYVNEVNSVTSYFELYHFLMQRHLMESKGYKEYVRSSVKIEEWCANVKKYGSFNKDFLWHLNLPFAYNLPRYKNLSMANLFDKNEIVEERGEETP